MSKSLEEKVHKTRTWPIVWVSLLLLLQTAAFAYLGYNNRPHQLETEFYPLVRSFFPAFIYLFISLLTLLTALSFLRRIPGAWLAALTMQGIDLAAALILYLNSRPSYIYLIMAVSIYLVIYLHYNDLQGHFNGGEI
jgi:uncharacterized membrane protein HdeD (DUF308 family)